MVFFDFPGLEFESNTPGEFYYPFSSHEEMTIRRIYDGGWVINI